MKKTEAKPVVQALCHDWANEQNNADLIRPSFGAFKRWIEARGCGRCLQFRSVGGPDMAAEMWFDAELKETRLRAAFADMEEIMADLAASAVSVPDLILRLQRHTVTNAELDVLRELKEAAADAVSALIDKARTTFAKRYGSKR